jgi:hypothetical protein
MDEGSQILVTNPSTGEFFFAHEEFKKYAGLTWSE